MTLLNNAGMAAAVVILALFCGCFSDGAEKTKIRLSTDELRTFQSCQNDGECVLVTNGCCDCANGGEEAAINKSSLDEFRSLFKCEDVACTLLARVPPCGTGTLACTNGICEFTPAATPTPTPTPLPESFKCQGKQRDCTYQVSSKDDYTIGTGSSGCAAEGELFSVVYTSYPEHCCAGLAEWWSGFDTRVSIADTCYITDLLAGSPVGTCIRCGDGNCGSHETVCNCPQDCVGKARSQYASIEEFCATVK